MKKIFTLLFLFVLAYADAQTPTYFNTNTAGGQNSIPFNSGTTLTWRRAQFCIPAGNLGSVPPGNNITKVYFQAGSSANVTYPTFTIRLKTAAATGMQGVTNGPFESGMTTVFQATNFNIQTVSGNWYGITLQTPFLYDPTFPLIVDFEHDHTSAAGPTVMQPGVISLSGSNGRQWGNNNGATIAGTGTQQFNFGIDVVPATPCTAPPVSNSLTPFTATVCPGYPVPALNMANTYSFGGITYQWFSSTTSSLGPFTAVNTATSFFSIPLPTVTVNTWYQVVATCTNPGGGSTTLTPAQVSVMPTTTNTVPYFEGFEGITNANELPNCSWLSSGGTCQTYTSSNTLNRVPRTGNKFASFYYNPGGTNYFYTNGVLLQAGVTYSAALWYTSEYYGYNNWTDLSILVGPGQSTTGLVLVASTQGPAISNIYKSLSNTFSVASTGMYYFAIRGTGSTASSAQYLSWDDFSVTVPCQEGSVNRPNLAISVPSASICSGGAVNLTGSGADTYTWSTGAVGQTAVDYPAFNTGYQLIGTNTLTGCTDTVSQAISVMPVPGVFIIASDYTICAGDNVNLAALSNDVGYFWSAGNNPTSSMITVSPASSQAYSVTATNMYGCSNTATVTIVVNTLPVVTVNSANNGGSICLGETLLLTANGGASYQWISSTSQVIYSGSPLTILPNATTTYTLIGTDINGCSNKTTFTQNVDICQGIADVSGVAGGYEVYPNPTAGEFAVVSRGEPATLIELVDVVGKVVVSLKPSSNSVKLNLSANAPGVYFLKIHANNKVEVMKLVKE